METRPFTVELAPIFALGELRTAWIVTGPGIERPISGIERDGKWIGFSQANAERLAAAFHQVWEAARKGRL